MSQFLCLFGDPKVELKAVASNMQPQHEVLYKSIVYSSRVRIFKSKSKDKASLVNLI